MPDSDGYEVQVEWSEPRLRQRYIFTLSRFRRIRVLIAGFFLWDLCFPLRTLTPLDVLLTGLRNALYFAFFFPALYGGFLAFRHWNPQNSTFRWTYRFDPTGIQASRTGRSYRLPWSSVRFFEEGAGAYYLGVHGHPKLLMIPRECAPGPEWVAAIETWSGKPLRQAGLLRHHC
jgi:hypothetical protein